MFWLFKWQQELMFYESTVSLHYYYFHYVLECAYEHFKSVYETTTLLGLTVYTTSWPLSG